MLKQKGLAHIFLILVLLVGIVAGVFLVGKTQIFKPKAAGASIEIGTNECVKEVAGKKTLVCASVPLKLVSPIDTGNASAPGVGFSLIKSVLAQESKGGVGYSCEKEGGDLTKIYHQKCNAIFFGINLCELDLPGTHYDLIQEDCDFGLVCDRATTDLFNTVAKCVPASSESSGNFQPPVFIQPGSGNNSTIPSGGGGTPPSFRTPTPTSVLTPTPRPTPTATPRATATPTPTPTSAPASTSVPAPTVNPNSSAFVATLALSPSRGTFNKGCSTSLDVNLDTKGIATDGTDAMLSFDPAVLKIASITRGNIYADYPGNTIDNVNGKISITGLAATTSSYTGAGTLAKINFEVKEDAPDGGTQINFDFDPNNKTKTTDSNVVGKVGHPEILSSVVNGAYTIIVGTESCPTSGVRTTLGYRVAETKDSLETAVWHDDYKAGGVNYVYPLQDIKAGPKFFFVQFRDQDKQVIKFESGNDYAVSASIDFGIPSSPSPSPTVAATIAPTSTPRPTAVPTSAPAPVVPTPVENNCPADIGAEPDNKVLIDNCNITQLSVLGNGRLMNFPLYIVAQFPTSRLKLFSNEDLITIADNSVGRKAFFSNFDCPKIGSFAQDIKDLFKTECGF